MGMKHNIQVHQLKKLFHARECRLTIMSHASFQFSNKCLYVNKYGPILSVEQETIVASNRDYNSGTIRGIDWV